MENELLKRLYDCFYTPPERKLVLRIIDAQDSIIELTSLDSFIAGFELAWRLSIELHNDETERSFFCQTKRTGARFVSEEPE